MISLPLPAAVIMFGTLGMAWASSNTPEVTPTRGDTPSTSQPGRSDTFGVTRIRSGSKSDNRWTPKRMRNAQPATPVDGAVTP
ncbi:MAG: hypothetical protein ACRDO7_16460 [Nocardioidaceae bacterium]